MCFSPDIAAIVDNVKQQHVELYSSITPSSFVVYRTLHPEYKYVECMSVFQLEGCSAGLNVDAMFCMLTQGDGWTLKGGTGCVRYATHLRA